MEAPFVFRPHVLVLATTLGAACKNSPGFNAADPNLQDTVQALAWAIFNDNCPDGLPHRAPLVVFTYLFALRLDTTELWPASHMTLYTAALTWLGRVTAYREILRLHALAPAGTLIDEVARSIYPAIKNDGTRAFAHIRSYVIVNHCLSPVLTLPFRSHLISISHKGGESPTGLIMWDELVSGRFWYNGNHLTMDGIREMVAAIVGDATDLMQTLFMGASFDDDAFKIRPCLVDEWTCRQTGYYFATEPKNNINRDALLKHILPQLITTSPDGQSWAYDIAACREWRDTYIKFTRLMAALFHILGGLPSHATETRLSTFAVDGGRPRTVRVGPKNQVFNIGTYHKTVSLTGGTSDQPRRPQHTHLL